MRKSKFLKIFSYCLIPILVLIFGISVSYEVLKERYNNKIDNSEYFKTDVFLNTYMDELVTNVKSLIYHNNDFNCIYDGNKKICFTSNGNWHFVNNTYYDLKNYYFLIEYKDLAITNVELTTKTNSIEKIKEFIQNNGNKKVNIINGEIESNSELFENKAIQYYDNFKNTYYSIEKESQTQYVIMQEDSSEIWITEEGTYNYNPNIDYSDGLGTDEFELLEELETKQWYNTTINDFKIYSTYNEDFVEVECPEYFKTFIEKVKPYENQMIYAIPISSILFVIILIYLIIAIGHTKDKEGIDFNDIDKIPIEIILAIGGTIATCIICVSINKLNEIEIDNYNFTTSLLLTGYFITYILCAVMGVTIVKRIKARNLIKDSLIGKACIWCWNILKKAFNKTKDLCKKIIIRIKKVIKETTQNWPDIVKFSIGIILYFLISLFLIAIFGFVGVIIALCVGGFFLYKFFENINSYKKIERRLKEMYDGNYTEKLDENEVTKCFKEVVEYINDISVGFERAREEGVKSERLKTELITNVSHDIKTPLTSIINYVDLLKKENIENEKIKEYIEILDNKSQRLKKLTEDLVEASKASSGNVKLSIEKINVVELIKQSTGEFEDKFKTKELEIISDFAEDEMIIKADNRYMYRIIENLFSNISKYAQEKSRVYIDVKRKENKVKIEVKNISKERLNISSDELMQRFVRGDKSRTTEGSGLGLSISRSLTELQKGTFNIQIDGDLFKVELEFEII